MFGSSEPFRSSLGAVALYEYISQQELDGMKRSKAPETSEIADRMCESKIQPGSTLPRAYLDEIVGLKD